MIGNELTSERMRVLAVAAAIVAVLAAVASALTTPLTLPAAEKLQIHNDHLVWLHVGTPGKWCRFRVRFDTSSTFLFQHSSAYSQSWAPLPYTDEHWQPIIQETVEFGTTRLRMPLVVGYFGGETSATMEGTQGEGVLGLGARSELWTAWRSFTKTRDYIYLGEVLHRVDAAGRRSAALHAPMADPLVYGASADAPSFVTQFSARLDKDSVKVVERGCRRSLLTDDTTLELAAEQELFGELLGLTGDEKRCELSTHEFTVLVAPEADYNVIPPMLMLHPPAQPPWFHLTDQNGTELHVILFDVFDDMYVETNPTNAAGTGVRRSANTAGRDDHTIVLGTYGMRRLEMSFVLDECRVAVAQHHAGLSQDGQSRHSTHSLEVRHARAIVSLIAGVILWAIWAAEPDPVFPRHFEMQEGFFHSREETLDVTPRPKPAANRRQAPASHQTRPATTVPKFVGDVVDDDTVIAVRAGRSMIEVPRDEPDPHVLRASKTPASAAPESPEPAAQTPSNDEARRLRELAENTRVRVWATYHAALSMVTEWPASREAVLYALSVSQAIMIAYIVMALAFYDTTWALSLVLDANATSNALGWTTLAVVFLAEALLSVASVAGVLQSDARLVSMCAQAQLLAALCVLMVSLFQWDILLAGLFIIIGILSVIVIMIVLHISDIVRPNRPREQALHASFRLCAVVLSLVYIAYAIFALFPFIINRLWDEQHGVQFIAAFIFAAIVLPLALWLSLLPLLYPYRLANAVAAMHFSVAKQLHLTITGRP